ncbi:MAG: glycoside hydrolase family 20 zincin-like fold domain-containing protein, partial [Bacteroidota bacterium]|nr:glycoside hydrolase family 20 zincin-like fold domain-containing protein [Bacteroidota bacterium]
MKRFIITSVFLTVIVTVFCQNNSSSIALIPFPVSIQPGNGSFTIKNSTFINLVTADADAKRVAGFLSRKLGTATGFSLQVKPIDTASKTQNAITLSLSSKDVTPGKEGYKLIITPTGIDLQANTAAGLFYGTQTLVQLLPKEIEGKQTVRNVS